MILALDLEGTLISNAVSQFPRPGLRDFIDFCLASFERVVMFTAVNEAYTRRILLLLADEGHVPHDFARDCEIVKWSGPVKDLSFVTGSNVDQVLLVDDREDYVHPAQTSQWIEVAEYIGPSGTEDRGLWLAMDELRRRLDAKGEPR